MRKEPNIKTTNLRFNLNKNLDCQAWNYLQSMDKQVFKSYNHVIALALITYFDRYYKIQADPYLETREREERFVAQIITAVENALEKTFPLFLAGYIASCHQPEPSSVPSSNPLGTINKLPNE